VQVSLEHTGLRVVKREGNTGDEIESAANNSMGRHNLAPQRPAGVEEVKLIPVRKSLVSIHAYAVFHSDTPRPLG